MKPSRSTSLFAIPVGLVTCLAGCIISDESTGTTSITWNIERGDPNSAATWSANRQDLACPAGFDTLRFVAQPVDSNGRDVGTPIIDLFDCADFSGVASPHPDGRYKVWIEITSADVSSVYAQSFADYRNLGGADATFHGRIVDNGGYFTIGWTLSGAGSAASCAEVAGENGVSVLATVSGSNEGFEDLFDCEDGVGTTSDLPHGTYTIATALLNGSDQSIGDAPVLTQKVLSEPNQFVDVGDVVIALR